MFSVSGWASIMLTDAGSGLFLGTLFFRRGVPETQQPLRRKKGCGELISWKVERPGLEPMLGQETCHEN